MKSATKWILFFAVQVNNYKISRANFSFSCHEQFIITQFVIAFSQSKEQSFFFFFFFWGGGGGGYYDHAFNFHPSFSSASFLLFLFSFGYSVFFFFVFFLALFTIAIVKQPHYKRISLHIHPVLHAITLCYIRSAVVLLGLPAYAFSLFTILGLSTIGISDSILAKDVTLDCLKACICFVHRSRDINFTSWLNNIDEFRCSMAEIASITTMFWTLSTILCQVYTGYLYHHPWSETQQTGDSMRVTVSLR